MCDDNGKSFIFRISNRIILELILLFLSMILSVICLYSNNMTECPLIYILLIVTTGLVILLVYEVVSYIRRLERCFTLQIKDNPSVIKKMKHSVR